MLRAAVTFGKQPAAASLFLLLLKATENVGGSSFLTQEVGAAQLCRPESSGFFPLVADSFALCLIGTDPVQLLPGQKDLGS